MTHRHAINLAIWVVFSSAVDGIVGPDDEDQVILIHLFVDLLKFEKKNARAEGEGNTFQWVVLP